MAGVAILLVLASPVLGLSMGAAGASSLPDDAVAKQGLAALQRDFPSGATDPVKIVVDGSPDAAALARVRADLGRDRDFAAGALTVETGPRITVATVPLTVEPTSERASAAIDRLRDEYVPRAFGPTGSHVYVGGKPAEDRDAFAVNSRWLPIVIAVVLALSFVLLTLAFRSIAMAGTAIAVNLLSVAAAYGILVAVFQNGVAAEAARLRRGRTDRLLGADLPVQRPVRSLDGLPGVPAQPDPRALDHRPATPRGPSSTASPPPPA